MRFAGRSSWRRRSRFRATATPCSTRSGARTSCSSTTGSDWPSRRPHSGREPRTGYDVSFPLFGDDLKPAARRFAVAETLSHLERLVQDGRAARHEADGTVSYTAPQNE